MIRLLEKLFNVLFPTTCIICGTEGSDICKKCLASFDPPKPSNHTWIISLSDYKDPKVETVMRHIKNLPNNRVAHLLAKKLTTLVPVSPSLNVIPIPIGRDRFLERGYNQAELLAKPLAKKLKVALITNVLYKKRKTAKQGTTHSKQEREQNLKNSFGIKNPHLIQDKDILLIDDITTTGSTLVEARNALLKSGARSVTALTIAN